MSETQYRVTVPRANMRQEPSVKAAVVAVIESGAIVHIDPERKPEGEWLPVLIVRGWMHKTTIKEIKPRA